MSNLVVCSFPTNIDNHVESEKFKEIYCGSLSLECMHIEVLIVKISRYQTVFE